MALSLCLKRSLLAKKNFEFHARLQKCHFDRMEKLPKMALLNPCIKFKTIFSQKTAFEAFWKCRIQNIFIICSRVHQIQYLGQSKYKLRLFSKRTHGISKILVILGFLIGTSYESLASLESKIRRCPFWIFIIVKKTSVYLHEKYFHEKKQIHSALWVKINSEGAFLFTCILVHYLKSYLF